MSKTTPSSNPYQFQLAEESTDGNETDGNETDGTATDRHCGGSATLWYFGLVLYGLAAAAAIYGSVLPHRVRVTAPPGVVQLVVDCLFTAAISLFVFGSIAILACFSFQKMRRKKLGTPEKSAASNSL